MSPLRFSIPLIFVCAAFAQSAPNRYTLILEDPPVAQRFPSADAMRSADGVKYRAQIETKQKALRDELTKRKIRVTGSVSATQNAIFVVAAENQVAELKSLPGVKDVVPQRRFQMRSQK